MAGRSGRSAPLRSTHRIGCTRSNAKTRVYISDLKPTVTVMNKQGHVIARWDSPMGHGLWVDSKGDIYLADVLKKGITKYMRKR